MERSGVKQSQQSRKSRRLLPSGRNDNCLTGLNIIPLASVAIF